MISSDHDLLLAAVLAAPDDDLPRLIFADYLEEQGHPALAARARFIRLQIEAEQHPPGSAIRLELGRQMGELRPMFHDEWATAFEPGELSGCVVNYRRGFVDELQIGLGKLLRLSERIFAAAPIRVLRIYDHEEGESNFDLWMTFCERPKLSQIKEVQFGPHLQMIVMNPICAVVVRMTSLIRLELPNNDLDNLVLVPIARMTPPASLRELDLSRNQLTDASAHLLAASTWPEQLQRLELAGNRFTADGIALLRRRFGEAVVV